MTTPSELITGDVVYLRSFRSYSMPVHTVPAMALHHDFDAPTGQVFVMLLLGTQPKDGSEMLDPFATLQSLGWTPPLNVPE